MTDLFAKIGQRRERIFIQARCFNFLNGNKDRVFLLLQLRVAILRLSSGGRLSAPSRCERIYSGDSYCIAINFLDSIEVIIQLGAVYDNGLALFKSGGFKIIIGRIQGDCGMLEHRRFAGRLGWRTCFSRGEGHGAGDSGDIHRVEPFGKTDTIILIPDRACRGRRGRYKYILSGQ